jgi:hypothetical protein
MPCVIAKKDGRGAFATIATLMEPSLQWLELRGIDGSELPRLNREDDVLVAPPIGDGGFAVILRARDAPAKSNGHQPFEPALVLNGCHAVGAAP